MKLALITGSTSGIGLGIAHALAEAGYNLLINGFGDKEQINKLIKEMQTKYKVKINYNNGDLTKQDHIISMMEQAKSLGGVDILVNNAGVQHVSPIDEFPPEKWDLIIGLNLTAAFHTIRLSLPNMKEKGWGRIINIASSHALVASPFKSAYVAAKHGLMGLTKSVALEVATKNITVNAICPGYVKTPLVVNQITATAKARGISEEEVINNVMLGPQATKKFVTIEEIGGIAAFLCSDSASSMTGSSIVVDGGWTAQ